MRVTSSAVAVIAMFAVTSVLRADEVQHAVVVDSAVVREWSSIARRAIVPAGPNGVFGAENFGNKFPGEAAVYLGIVHAAIYDAAVAIAG